MKFLILCTFILLFAAACSSSQGGGFADLPAGDAARGAQLFTESISGAPACATCHTLDTTVRLGPGMEGYGARAGGRVAGESAEVYTYSITQPAAHVVSDFSNSMYAQYARQLSQQQIADLIAYLLTL